MTGLYSFISFFLNFALHFDCIHYITQLIDWKNLKAIQFKDWSKSEVKRKNRDLCKTKKVIKRQSEIKNIAGQVLMYNLRNFHWPNKKLNIERTMSELGKPFLEKSDEKILKKKTENWCQNAACEQKIKSRKLKFGSNKKKWSPEWTTNGLEKSLRKKSEAKKTTSEKANFCSNTVLSLYFKNRTKKFTPQNH